MMAKGLFILGTDTAVGKTLIAGALARSLSLQGINVGVMKPMETGCQSRRGVLLPSDGNYLKMAARVTDSIDLITPYRYRDPVAPWVASLREKRKINLKKIVQAYDRLCQKHSFLIVEGIGGLMVPLTFRLDLIDLILLLDLPVLLVSRNGLGMLNHTQLTIRYGLQEGLRFLGIIVNQTSPQQTLADQTNLDILRERMEIPILGKFPYVSSTVKKKWIERSSELLRQAIQIERITALTK